MVLLPFQPIATAPHCSCSPPELCAAPAPTQHRSLLSLLPSTAQPRLPLFSAALCFLTLAGSTCVGSSPVFFPPPSQLPPKAHRGSFSSHAEHALDTCTPRVAENSIYMQCIQYILVVCLPISVLAYLNMQGICAVSPIYSTPHWCDFVLIPAQCHHRHLTLFVSTSCSTPCSLPPALHSPSASTCTVLCADLH